MIYDLRVDFDCLFYLLPIVNYMIIILLSQYRIMEGMRKDRCFSIEKENVILRVDCLPLALGCLLR